jgi:galactokinase
MPFPVQLPEELKTQLDYQLALDESRKQQQIAIQHNNAKLEALRMAKEIVMENHRTLPVEKAITAGDITSMASELQGFVTS